MTIATDQDRILTFPNRIVKRQAEVAIARDREQQQTRREIADALNLGPRYRLGRYLDLGDETYVAEVLDREDATWTVVYGGRRDAWGHYTVDEAILRAVELRNGGGVNDRGHVYAARMLGVGKPAEEATR